MESPSTSGEDLGALLESTLTLSRGLETLYNEHEVLLEALAEDGRDSSRSTIKAEQQTDSGHNLSHGMNYRRQYHCYTVEMYFFPGDISDVEDSAEFAVELKVEKTAALSQSLNLLRAGLDEAKVHTSCMHTLPTLCMQVQCVYMYMYINWWSIWPYH